MAFCTNCGAALADGARFCTNCGAKQIPAPEPAEDTDTTLLSGGYTPPEQNSYTPPTQNSYTPPEQKNSYTPPTQNSYTPPTQNSYTPPTQNSYTPPTQNSYTPPTQNSYTPPTQNSYTPPMQNSYTPPTQGGYTPPTQSGGGGYNPPPSYPSSAKAVKEKKPVNKMIFVFGGIAIVAIILVVVLVKLLGGGAGSDSPYVGTWNAVSVEAYGYEMGIEEIYADGMTLELKANGKSALTFQGTSYSGKWTYEDSVMNVTGGGVDLSGTVNGGEMSLTWADYGMTFIFEMEGSAGAAAVETGSPASAEPTAEDTSYLDWWDGDWYGWWIVANKTGEYEDWVDNWWDCCARISVDASGSAAIVFWDEYDSEDSPTAEFAASVDRDGMTVGAGSFMSMTTSADDFTVETGYDGYENLIRITGYYEDSEGSFDFAIYMRPWGQLWDDWYANDDTCLPYYYTYWYLPAIDDDAAMPGEINGDYVAGSGTGFGASSGDTAEASSAPVSDSGYGKTTADADGVVSFDVLKSTFDWLHNATSYDGGYQRPTYEEIVEHLGGVNGTKALEQYWEDDFHVYRWCSSADDFLLLSFNVAEDGTETWCSSSWSSSLND